MVPGWNDSDDELTELTGFLSSVSPDIPWHVTAFHQDYRMTDPDDTPASTLLRAHDIGRREGLHYVYPGNLPGRVGTGENTICPQCSTLLVERHGFKVLRNCMQAGACPRCGTSIPGIWT